MASAPAFRTISRPSVLSLPLVAFVLIIISVKIVRDFEPTAALMQSALLPMIASQTRTAARTVQLPRMLMALGGQPRSSLLPSRQRCQGPHNGGRSSTETAAMLVPNEKSQASVLHLMRDLGITDLSYVEKLISKSLDKLDWESVDEEDGVMSEIASSLKKGTLPFVEDPFQKSEETMSELMSLGLDKNSIKSCVLRFPALLRIQPEMVRDVVASLSKLGMSSLQQKVCIHKWPAILAYDAERHIEPAFNKLRKRTKLPDRSIATLVANQPNLLTAMIDEMWSSRRANALLTDARETQDRQRRREGHAKDDDRDMEI